MCIAVRRSKPAIISIDNCTYCTHKRAQIRCFNDDGDSLAIQTTLLVFLLLLFFSVYFSCVCFVSVISRSFCLCQSRLGTLPVYVEKKHTLLLCAYLFQFNANMKMLIKYMCAPHEREANLVHISIWYMECVFVVRTSNSQVWKLHWDMTNSSLKTMTECNTIYSFDLFFLLAECLCSHHRILPSKHNNSKSDKHANTWALTHSHMFCFNALIVLTFWSFLILGETKLNMRVIIEISSKQSLNVRSIYVERIPAEFQKPSR